MQACKHQKGCFTKPLLTSLKIGSSLSVFFLQIYRLYKSSLHNVSKCILSMVELIQFQAENQESGTLSPVLSPHMALKKVI